MLTRGKLFGSSKPFQTIAILILMAGCAARQPGDPLEPGFNIYSPEDDIEIGRRAATEIETQVEIVTDEGLQDYVGGVGQSLARNAAARDYPYRFTLINDPSLNAFALPGGPIYIHSGIGLAAANEAQFAGVLAHEISHVALRHGTNQASTASLVQVPAVLAGAAIGQDSTLAQLGQLGLGFGVNSLMLRYSRSAEREADALGALLMTQAGYDPMEMASFFETLEAEAGGEGLPEFFSSHPSPGSRIENVRAELETLPRRTYDRGTGRFAEFKTRIQSLPEPRPRPAARVVTPDRGSGDLRVFEGQGFSVTYPSEWNVYGDRQSGVVTIAPEGGVVRTSSGASSLVYGVVFSVFPTEGSSLSVDTRALLSELQSVNPHLEVRGDSEALEVDRRPGLLSQLSGRSSLHGQIENILLITTQHQRSLFYIVLVAPQADFEEFSDIFDVMYRSVRF